MATEIAVKNAVTHPGVSELNKIAIIVLVLSHFWCYCRQRIGALRGCGLNMPKLSIKHQCSKIGNKLEFCTLPRNLAKRVLAEDLNCQFRFSRFILLFSFCLVSILLVRLSYLLWQMLILFWRLSVLV